MPSSGSRKSDISLKTSSAEFPRAEVAKSADNPLELSGERVIAPPGENLPTAAAQRGALTLDLSAAGGLDINVESGRQYYETFLEKLLEGALNRKGTFEQRGIMVVTTAGTLVTVVFAIVSFVLAHVSKGVNPHSVIRSWIDTAAILFVAASVLGLLVNLPVSYGEPDPLELADLVLPDDDIQDDVASDQSLAQVLERTRRLIENRALLAYARLDGMIARLQQLLSQEGQLPLAQFVSGMLSHVEHYVQHIDEPENSLHAAVAPERWYTRWFREIESYVDDPGATAEVPVASIDNYLRGLEDTDSRIDDTGGSLGASIAELGAYMLWLEDMDMLAAEDGVGETAGLPFLTATANEASLQIAQTRVKLLLQARKRNSLKSELLFVAILSEVAAIASLAWGIHGLLGL